MLIPGFIISFLTFPGVIAHEIAHLFFCHLTGTRVLKVCYFRFGNPSGYVVHVEPSNIWKQLLIGIGPLIVNSVVGFCLGYFAFGSLKTISNSLQGYLLAYLALCIGMHAFPSTGDAKSIWSALWRPSASWIAKIVGVPLVGILFLFALGSIFWLDLVYGVAIALYLPYQLVK